MRRSRVSTAVGAALAALLLVTAAGCAGIRSAATDGSTSAAPQSTSVGTEARTDSSNRLAANGAPAGYAASPLPQAATVKGPAADRMVIRSGNLRLEVTKVPDSVKSLRALAAKYGGSVAELDLSSDTGNDSPEPASGTSRKTASGLPYSGSVTVRVPVAKLDAFRTDVEGLGRVLSERAADEDVTQQHADLAARLKNSQAEEARLRSFFEKARSVGDMLAIEKQLERVRGDIESMSAQLVTMERQAAMATLTVELVEPEPIVRPAGIDWGFGEAVTAGVQGLAALLQAAMVMLIAGAPVWLAAIAAYVLIRWRMKARRERHAESAA